MRNLRVSQVESIFRRGLFVVSLLALMFFLVTQTSSAQSTGGRIRGTVTDASGAAVAARRIADQCSDKRIAGSDYD